jgi:hypothetical protein
MIAHFTDSNGRVMPEHCSVTRHQSAKFAGAENETADAGGPMISVHAASTTQKSVQTARANIGQIVPIEHPRRRRVITK